jgi:HlyD family type I secretion membrane fusion protein
MGSGQADKPNSGMAKYITRINSGRTILAGGVLAGALLVSFSAWAVFAPLNSAVVASGFVKVSGYRQKIQHLEGGIIKDILVKEGDRIEKNQILLRLHSAQLLASEQLLRGQLASAQALEARIKSEQIESKVLTFPDDLNTADANLKQFMEAQRNIFNARADAYAGSLVLKDEKVRQSEEEAKAYRALIVALRKQLPLIQIEIDDQNALWSKQLTRKSQVHQLRRTEAQIEAEVEKNNALIARTLAVVAEIREEKIQMRRKILDELAQERKAVTDTIHELRQRLASVEEGISRLEVRAPISGTVVMLNVNTLNGVVAPREVLLEIVPADAKLVIETSLKAADIDVVRPGQSAQIQFSSYTARRSNKVSGHVALISADRIVDAKGNGAFKVDLEVAVEDVSRIAGLKLSPGMPADAFIETGERTFMRYLIAPVLDSINRGIREK